MVIASIEREADMATLKVADIMTSSVTVAKPDDSIAYAAWLMADQDVGVLPVVQDGGVVGVVTDRDVAVRAVAGGISPQSEVRRIMTDQVICCSPDDELEHAIELMSNEQVRRLPVCGPGGNLAGIIALADAAHRD